MRSRCAIRASASQRPTSSASSTRFSRDREASPRPAEGTGLGLTLSKQIVELHGGRLWVASRAGHGSTFTFALPVGGPAHALELDGSDAEPREVPAARPDGPGRRGRPALARAHDALPPRGRLRGASRPPTPSKGSSSPVVCSRMRSCSTSSCPTWMGGICWRSSRPTLARRGFPLVIVSMLDERGRGFALGAADYLVKPVGREDVVAGARRGVPRPRR